MSILSSQLGKLIYSYLQSNPKLYTLFENCFYNTLNTTTEFLSDGSVFVFTGDIPAMWLRDSSAQVRHYIPLAKTDEKFQQLIEGLIKRQLYYIEIDPYANAFNKEANNASAGYKDKTEHNPWVWERKYEIDSLCYPIQLSYLYWKETDRTSLFDDTFKKVVNIIMDLWTLEQNHSNSHYTFQRMDCPPTDTLKNDGKGMPVNYTGMTWCGFRPSDDACTFNYLIPSNMFAVVVLKYVEEIACDVYRDYMLAKAARKLCEEIDYGIRTYGIYRHPRFGDIFAYETDGFGNYNLMDDANVPSLLSIPYLQYTTNADPVYQNTRRFILSDENPYYFQGKYAKGIGSPHTPENYIWHIGLIMQALTSSDDNEIKEILQTIINTDAGTGFMHEGFNVDNPGEFTRPWFAWANSLFSELIYKLIAEGKHDLFEL